MRKVLLVLAVSMGISGSTFAFNLSFMQYSSTYYFTKSDWAISEKTAMRALNSARDNTKVSWSNPETKANGYFMPFNTTTQNGLKCRKMEIVSQAHGVPGQSIYRFCKIRGEWKITN